MSQVTLTRVVLQKFFGLDDLKLTKALAAARLCGDNSFGKRVVMKETVWSPCVTTTHNSYAIRENVTMTKFQAVTEISQTP